MTDYNDYERMAGTLVQYYVYINIVCVCGGYGQMLHTSTTLGHHGYNMAYVSSLKSCCIASYVSFIVHLP